MNLNAFIRPAIIMAAFAAGAALLLWFVYQHATPILAQHQQENLLAQLNTLVPSTVYDNDLAKDKITVNNKALNAKGDITIYRARHSAQPVASLLLVSAPNGYSGEIKLLVAVWADGSLAGVRVLAHKETPGLGDYIEEKRSPWVHQFDGKSLNAPTIERWKVKKDGGAFTYNTGATITPRAIVGTVAKTLSWVQAQGQRIYAASDNIQGAQP
jgi:electron transport complex protein RnfG